MPKIKVNEKALAHLSRGLYRSPASALKELVSNGWDANATEVRLDTNYPNFLRISVEDDGDGFTRDEFKELMEGGIGNSKKRSEYKPLKNNRPIIGRLGIGMLGIAQICGGFTVLSRPKKGEGFKARIQLYDLLKEKLDEDDKTIIVGKEEIDVGEYSFLDYAPSEARFGTFIIADDIHPTFVRSFQSSLKNEAFKEPNLDWTESLKILSRVRSLQELGDYWRLLWELAASCPIQYINDHALPQGLVIEENEQLKSYQFSMIIDGIKLFKPIYLKGNPGGYTVIKIGRQNQKIYGKDLSFHGYIIVQEGAQLRPDELRGLLIRIKNVGIGYYDPSMLDYRYNEGPRAKWITGEIFIDIGLENALNIDRDSFNRFHPEFRAIQEYIHKILHDNLFPEVYKKIDARSLTRSESKDKKRLSNLKNIISKAADNTVVIRKSDQISEPNTIPRAFIIKKASTVNIELPNPDTLLTKKSNRQLAASILAIYEIALNEKTIEKQRALFTQMLLKLLSEW